MLRLVSYWREREKERERERERERVIMRWRKAKFTDIKKERLMMKFSQKLISIVYHDNGSFIYYRLR